MTGWRYSTDRKGKLGTKRHFFTDQDRIPLSVVITAANTHDVKSTTEALDKKVINRQSLHRDVQNLFLC
ncbi:MAG: transposase [Nitrososphaeraceae archaeon]